MCDGLLVITRLFVFSVQTVAPRGPGRGSDLVEEVVAAHGAVPLGSSHHEVLDVHHGGPARLHGDHVEALAGQVVTWHKRELLTLGEGGGVAAQRRREEQEVMEEQEQRRGGGGEHGRTDRKHTDTEFTQ